GAPRGLAGDRRPAQAVPRSRDDLAGDGLLHQRISALSAAEGVRPFDLAPRKNVQNERPDPLIELAGVSKVYAGIEGPVAALEAVSLDVAEGEFVSILGPSGCGKSTLLLIVAGLLPPSAGTVRLAGQAVTRPQTDIGIVFQTPVLLDWRTVLRNVLLQVESRGLDVAAYRPKARELLRSVGLDGFEDRYPFELSGGMRQRAAI